MVSGEQAGAADSPAQSEVLAHTQNRPVTQATQPPYGRICLVVLSVSSQQQGSGELQSVEVVQRVTHVGLLPELSVTQT